MLLLQGALEKYHFLLSHIDFTFPNSVSNRKNGSILYDRNGRNDRNEQNIVKTSCFGHPGHSVHSGHSEWQSAKNFWQTANRLGQSAEDLGSLPAVCHKRSATKEPCSTWGKGTLIFAGAPTLQTVPSRRCPSIRSTTENSRGLSAASPSSNSSPSSKSPSLHHLWCL